MSGLGIRSWLTVAALPLLGLSVGLIVSANATRDYRATSVVTITVQPSQPPGSIILIPTAVGNGGNASGYASAMAAITRNPGPVFDGLGLPIPSRTLAKEISAHGDDRTGLVAISVTDPDPANAARFANAAAARLAQFLVSSTTGDDGIAPITAVPTAPATVPTAALRNPWRADAIAGSLGGLLAALIVTLANVMGRTRNQKAAFAPTN